MDDFKKQIEDAIWDAMNTHDDSEITINMSDHVDEQGNPFQVITGTLWIGKRRAWIQAATATGIIEDAWDRHFEYTATDKQMKGWLAKRSKV